MAFRFRRSIKIAPGIRLNVGKRGASISAGVRGASVTAGSRGVHGNVGIPGTGMSVRKRLDTPARKARPLDSTQADRENLDQALSKITLSLAENGSINAVNAFGEPLSRSDMRLVWEQQTESVTNWLLERAGEINGDAALLSNIHLGTPSPRTQISYEPMKFSERPPKVPVKVKPPQEPLRPEPARSPITARIFAKKREAFEESELKRQADFDSAWQSWQHDLRQIEEQYNAEHRAWQHQRMSWMERLKTHKKAEERRRENFPTLIKTDLSTMETVLDQKVNNLEWPRETLVSYEISEDRQTIWCDVDLPEIEDLPCKVAGLAASGKKLNIKKKPQKQLRLEYASHIHGIAFRLAGTVFAALPAAENVVISGYSQRLDSATGKVNDDYLISAQFKRAEIEQIDFSALEKVDPVKTLGIFEHRRKMTATGIFKPIDPLAPSNDS